MNGEAANALPPLWPGVCQVTPAFTATYCFRTDQNRGIQNDWKRWTRRSCECAGSMKAETSFFAQRRCGTVTGACPG